MRHTQIKAGTNSSACSGSSSGTSISRSATSSWDLAFMVWTIANTLTIVFIAARRVRQSDTVDVNTRDDGAARRRGDLGVPRDHLRVHDRDGRMGALGRDDRVHVHGAAVAGRPPGRAGRVRGALRDHPGDDPLLRRRRAVSADPCSDANYPAALALLAIASLSFIGDRDHDLGAAARSRLRRARSSGSSRKADARRVGRLLLGDRHAGVDAVALEDLAGDVRAAGDRAAILGGALAWERRLAVAHHRRPRNADRAGDLPRRRAVREAGGQAQEVRVSCAASRH